MNDILLNKVPPQNIEAEESLLSALFIKGNCFDLAEGLKPKHFYKSAHGKIFNSMLSLHKKHEPIDLVTVAQELIEKEELESVGGAAYLSTISEASPMALNIVSYAKIIKDLSKARELIAIASGIVEKGFSVSDIEEYISESQKRVLEIQTTSSKDKIYNMESLMHEAVDRIEKAQASDTEQGFKFGMPMLDTFTNITGSKLFLIAGRPAMGKTALALSIALYLANRGIKVGFLSIEMDKDDLSDRLLSIESNINSLCFYSKDTLGDESIRKLYTSAENLSVLPIYVDDSDCNIQDVERKCRKFKKIGCEIIFIDQLSKIRGERGKSKFEQYTENCSAIALLKKELRIPIGLLCQIGRGVESTNDKVPTMSDLKQTGMLEEDADLIYLIFRPGYYDDNIDASRSDIILAKNRQGATGTEQQVTFNKKRGMFNLI
jgi:replicative DNA helicase